MTYRYKCVSFNETHETHEDLPKFCKFNKYEKTSMTVAIDVGLDENPCYTNTIKCAIGYFMFDRKS